ncbi:MAG TPA: hypothetical protein VFC15_06485, partial [Candidatus Limnocylindrales bacterium]|nr:hypothetical protein [Candidatus Limnocylindrales bacterium]
SWMTGINEVAQVVFVRKRMVEVQYLRATITDQQRQEFAIPGRRHRPQYRIGTVPAAQRHPLPPEPLYDLPFYWAMSGAARSD